MNVITLSKQELYDTYAVIDNHSEDFDTPKPCTLEQLQELSKETERPIRHAGMLAVRFYPHHEHGEVIILTSGEQGGIMIHA